MWRLTVGHLKADSYFPSNRRTNWQTERLILKDKLNQRTYGVKTNDYGLTDWHDDRIGRRDWPKHGATKAIDVSCLKLKLSSSQFTKAAISLLLPIVLTWLPPIFFGLLFFLLLWISLFVYLLLLLSLSFLFVLVLVLFLFLLLL